MKRVVDPAGYTIVETMIFLAVSAALFVSASALITGKQRKTQFATTVREFSSKIESVYGNVGSGYYNSSGKVTCTESGNKVNLTTDGANQGTNADCIYLGQVVVSPRAKTSDFKIISLVGLRQHGSPPVDVEDIKDADPTLYTDLTETYTLAGADFVSVKADNTLVSDNAGTSVGFIGALASYDNSQILNSGRGHTDIYTIPSDDISRNGTIEDTLAKGNATPAKTIHYCLSNGEQYANVTLEGGISSYAIGDAAICS